MAVFISFRLNFRVGEQPEMGTFYNDHGPVHQEDTINMQHLVTQIEIPKATAGRATRGDRSPVTGGAFGGTPISVAPSIQAWGPARTRGLGSAASRPGPTDSHGHPRSFQDSRSLHYDRPSCRP